MRTTLRRLWGPALALAGVSVGSAHASAQVPTTVTVENTRDVPVVVYLERGYYDARLGTVAPRSTNALDIPIALADGDEIQFIVHPEGGADLATPLGLRVARGRPLDIFVPTNDVGFVAPPPRPTVPYTASEGSGGATVTVENRRRRPVVVFVEAGELDARVGTVDAGRTDTLPLPAWLSHEAREVGIFVHVEGGEDLASQEFALAPDAHLFVKVPS